MITQVLEQKLVTGVVGTGNMAELYKITNTITGKSYIGYTSKTSQKRFTEHFNDAIKYNRDKNRKFYNAIRKYGEDCWQVEILIENLSVIEAKEKEIELIQFYNTYNEGYNATRGGDGNNGIIMSEESNIKRSNVLKGISKKYDRMLGKTHSQESKNKISKSHKGMSKPWAKWNEEQITKRAMTRRKISKEQYEKIDKLLSLGVSLKEISQKVNLSYDMTKKWSRRSWNVFGDESL